MALRRPGLVAWIKRWRLTFAVGTVLLYVIAVPVTIIVFPANSLWVALVVLFSGLTGALAALADMLVSAEVSDHTVADDTQT